MNKKFKLNALEGKLVNIEYDADYNALNEGFFKTLVSGEHIEVEHKYRGTDKFKPVVTMWVATNVLPKVTTSTISYYRRICILECGRVFLNEEQDRNLLHKLKEELSGITAWALQAGEDLRKNGACLVESESSKDNLHDYQIEQNHVQEFVETMVERETNVKIKRDELYGCYCSFCKENNYTVLNNARFGRELKNLGIESHKTATGRFYKVGIKNPS